MLNDTFIPNNCYISEHINHKTVLLMKKIMIFAAFLMLFSSCAVHKASVSSTAVYSPAIETTTIATIDVSSKKITYMYTPAKTDSKSLSEKQLIQNAIYEALQANGNADELVEVNYFMSMKRRFPFGKRVKYVIVSGYPATYSDFREPDCEDKDAVETFSRSRMYRQSKLDQLSLGDNQ